MLRSFIIVFLLSLLYACTNHLPESMAISMPEEQTPYHTQYDRLALKNIKWLTGDWKGKENGLEIVQSFLFHTDNLVEVNQMTGGKQKGSMSFIWKDGHYYYGQNQQWIVTWISEKNIRFDPLVSGLKPMTWSRVNENKWHLIRHEATGDEVIVMERLDKITS